jgi:cytochrome c peroxidase
MALFNLAFQRGGLFWDGREPTLEKQILRPVENPVEMHLSWQEAVPRIQGRKDYVEMYEKAFGTKEITKEGVAKSIAQFLRTIVSANSPYDRAELSDSARAGSVLFLTAPVVDPGTGYRRIGTGLDCVHCHNPPLFQPEAKLEPFMNNGTDSVKQFRVPSLRNVALSHPYMHDGRFKTLQDVVNHYNKVTKSPGLDPNMFVIKHALTDPGSPDVQLKITSTEAKQLIAFLRSLTDDSLTVKKEYGNPFRK